MGISIGFSFNPFFFCLTIWRVDDARRYWMQKKGSQSSVHGIIYFLLLPSLHTPTRQQQQYQEHQPQHEQNPKHQQCNIFSSPFYEQNAKCTLRLCPYAEKVLRCKVTRQRCVKAASSRIFPSTFVIQIKVVCVFFYSSICNLWAGVVRVAVLRSPRLCAGPSWATLCISFSANCILWFVYCVVNMKKICSWAVLG